MNKIMRNEPNLGQSQIILNGSINNGLRRKNEIGHLVKTNPNEPNFKIDRTNYTAYLQGRRIDTVVPLPGLLVMESEPPFNWMSRAA
jgi:hypothetical protein